jgi:chemotaxis protein methyltransferase CheR
MPTHLNPALDKNELGRLAQLATSMTGLEFPECRLPDLARAVRETIVQFSLARCEDLYRLLIDAQPDHPVARAFISHLTIGETHFFRNQPQFEALAATILPEIIEQRRSQRRLRIWSAACATGEEPYSIAILLDRLLPTPAEWEISILATDIDHQALERAQHGLYGAWSFRQVDEELRTRYFTQQGRFYELAPTIRRRVTFAPLNLVEATYPSLLNNTAQMDLILCRNVLIYFSPRTTRGVVDRLYLALRAGGWLLVGHAEPSQEIFARYATINLPATVAYRRPYEEDCAPAAPCHQLSARKIAETPVRPMDDAQPLRLDERPATSPTAPPKQEWPAQPAQRQPLPALIPHQQGEGAAAYAAAREYAERRQWAAAEQWIGRALEQTPLLAAAHALHALLLLEAGCIEAAITAARRGIYADPNYVAGHLLLAQLYRHGGDGRRADAAQRSACTLLRQYAVDAVVPDTDGATAAQLLASMEQTPTPL